jgi:hypothetical protein
MKKSIVIGLVLVSGLIFMMAPVEQLVANATESGRNLTGITGSTPEEIEEANATESGRNLTGITGSTPEEIK